MVTSFKQVYYTVEKKIRSSGSGRVIGLKLYSVDYTSFIFMGIEMNLPSNNTYIFQEDSFESRMIWIDSRIKYGGKEYFPKIPITTFSGINLENYFFNYLKENRFFILNKNEKTFFLCNCDSNARKILRGKRLTKSDRCNNPVVKIKKEHVNYLNFLDVKKII